MTDYMDFHPGGDDELMRGVGKDATQLFDEVRGKIKEKILPTIGLCSAHTA